MAAGEFTAATVRRVFFERDGAACFLCRAPLRFEDRGIGWSMHHRKPRGAGGVKGRGAEVFSSAANALTLCGSGTTGCHGEAEKNRDVALDRGVLISRLGRGPAFDPPQVRVQRNDKTWWLLTESGRAIEVESKSWA
ncbi:hypothetical protein NS220_06100 [Microbacterium testaceum]|uniref:HNH endonuclease n=1 Tax=Microbacterium testaceum TaxID=2033 RepID=A0A147EYK9_MICTE|nr:hypothetical protein [Microbacterium testaceum]KTR95371.1 hypothetical protein NS220_06100 [Microbacterium testaceum]